MTGAVGALTSAVVEVLAGLGSVEVYGLRVEHSRLSIPDARSVPYIGVDIHADDYAGALAVVERFALVESETRTSEAYGGGVLLWRTWAGWVSGDGSGLPVSVEVTASEDVPAEADAALFDKADAA
ncbi:hypothetical protein L1785_12220 [Antribacter sp. KLBMP9083]|uniref:Uncharacterized protein n=1 Tax=Antribacter soli TaxID=2910976 RepID=A0AA41QGN4_9MICO|nr:hypothetical protein [Antribacter soli]MCF4121749.1 hypothetical protein [Antribacter soli]